MAVGKRKKSLKRWRRRNKYIKIEDTNSQRKRLAPGELLVGFDGRISKKRLRPLRRSRADKMWKNKLRQDYEDQCYRLEKQMKYHHNLICQMDEISEEKDTSPEFVQELHELHRYSLKCLRHLLKGIQLPLKLEEFLETIILKDKEIRETRSYPVNGEVKNIEESTPFVKENNKKRSSREKKSQTHVTPNPDTVQLPERTSPPMQMFVYGIPRCKVVMLGELYPEDKGKDLINAIAKAAGRLPSKCVILHANKRLLEGRSLADQGIANEANIYLSFNLLGGMKSAAQGAEDGNTDSNTEDPRRWTKARVSQWVDSVCTIYEINQEEVKTLKTLNGAGLSKLAKEDWKLRSEQGDFLYNEWQSIITPSQQRPALPRKEDSLTVEAASTIQSTSTGDEIPKLELIETNESFVNQMRGPFGEIEDLDELPGMVSIDDLIDSTPEVGTIISVLGLCSSRPLYVGGAGTVLLRNDPDNPSTFFQLKVDLRSESSSSILTKHKIGNVLNINLGDEMAVRGRVEGLDKGFTSKRRGFNILPFKIVVDSDTHAAVRETLKTNVPSLFRQLSTPWPVHCGVFPAEVCSQPLYLGDFLEPDANTVLLAPGTNIDKVKEYVVALRNRKTGDVFIGISDERKLIGESIRKEQIIQRREELCKAVGGILPSVDAEICVCDNANSVLEMTSSKKSFIAFMWLQGEIEEEMETEDSDAISILIQLHVTKGSKPVHFKKQSDTRAFVRVGTETKMMSDYNDLYDRLESLSWRNVSFEPSKVTDEIKQASIMHHVDVKYKVFKRLRFETEEREFKAIYGKPKEIILKDYISEYTAAFLNTQGGDIYFGVEEDKATKIGYVTGVVLSSEEREQLLKESAEKICNFWPHVESCHFLITFIDIEPNGVLSHALKFPKTSIGKDEQPILLRFSSGRDIDRMNAIKGLVKGENNMVSLVRVKDQCYCLLAESPSKINLEQFVFDLERNLAQFKNISLDCISKEELQDIVNNLCVVRLKVEKSPLPIHLTQPLVTYTLDKEGKLQNMGSEEVLERFQRRIRKNNFDIKKFLKAVNGFDKTQCSFVLMTAPFELSQNESDLLGLVIPEWTMVLDFDQHLKSKGHLFSVVQPLHDLHQTERNLFLKTPNDRKIEVNPDNGVCWYAVRGYDELGDTLSMPGHGNWHMKHGDNIKSHLKDQLIMQVNPNHLFIVCLWTEGQEEFLPSMQMLIEQFFSSWSRTTVVFVCPNERAEKILLEKLIEPLENSYKDHIRKENVFVVPIHHLSRHLAIELKTPFQPENSFQTPKRHLDVSDRIVPETLPQYIRQAIQGHLKMMYLKTGSVATKEEIEEEKKKFFSGSAIGTVGLAHGIGFKREKLKDLKKELKSMLKDRMSHVCMIVLKADRGSGASTLCRQLLYEFHTRYPCAQLTDFQKNLVTNIDKINKYTNLPLILYVDSEMANWQDFSDFKMEAERRNVDIVFIVVDSEVTFSKENDGEVYGKQKKKTSKLRTPYTTGAAPYKTVELNRELERSEIPRLVEELCKLVCISEDKKVKLLKMQDKAMQEKSLRKFAYFSLTVFGKEFTRLSDYVKYRLDKTSEIQAHILDFLAITHVFTESYFPVNALSKMLTMKVVSLETVFINPDVFELLSPPGKGSRRISFGEVAEEILKQRASRENLEYVEFLQMTALRMARDVLSVREPSKRIDRLNRRLFITSEYECHKYSPLIRFMRDKDKNTASDTLQKLTEIFPEDTSLWAHLQAHLAKFYMLEHRNFAKALPCIETALREHNNDNLLHHIHGDVIRIHIQNLKSCKKIDVYAIVKLAIRSSVCFERVREKRPLQEYGYKSDALVRRIVMEAAVKSIGSEYCYADYLSRRLKMIAETEEKEALNLEDKFLFALIPEAFGFLQDVQMTEHTEQIKKALISSMGSLEKVQRCCEEFKHSFSGTSDEEWVKEISLRTINFVGIIEMEAKNPTPEDTDKIVARMEKLTRTGDDERSMRTWIRYARNASKVPRLQAVCDKVAFWVKTTNGESLYAGFYKYVTAVLTAIQDPSDKKKMESARKAIEDVHCKRYLKKRFSRSPADSSSLQVEWLHPKEGRHINSIDCLLHNDDLMKEYLTTDDGVRRKGRPQREIVEKALFVRNITKWEGVVESIETEWKGTICMKSLILIHFVPAHVTPFMPASGDIVQFYLSFDWNGPRAWGVVCQPGQNKGKKAKDIRPAIPLKGEYESENDSSESDDDTFCGFVGTEPLYKRRSIGPPPQVHDPWEELAGLEMQGLVRFANEKGFGKLWNPKIDTDLFFHSSRLFPPVNSMAEVPEGTVLTFRVEKQQQQQGCQAVDIRKITDEELICKELTIVLSKSRKEQETHKMVFPSSSKPQPKRQSTRLEGTVISLFPVGINPKTHGFIKVEGIKDAYFFHVDGSRIGIAKMGRIGIGARVQFLVDRNDKGPIATDVYIQGEQRTSPSTCSCGWEGSIGNGIQEGFISFLSREVFGFISKEMITRKKQRGIYFMYSDIRNCDVSSLQSGMKVYFRVESNERGCIAKDIFIHQNMPIPHPSIPQQHGYQQIPGFPPRPMLRMPPPRPFGIIPRDFLDGSHSPTSSSRDCNTVARRR